MIVTHDRVGLDDFRSATGWELKAEGACKGELCVPLPAGAMADGTVDVVAAAGRLGMAVVDDASGLRAVGPETVAGHALTTAEAPDLVLPDLGGNPFSLRSLRGHKVVLVAWAPY